MLVTVTGAIVNWPNPNPTVDVVYGPEIETSAGSEIISTPIIPKTLITIANITSFDYWRRYEFSAGTYSIESEINIPLLKVTEIRMGFSFSIINDTATVTAAAEDWNYGEAHYITNSSALGIGAHSLTLTLPWSGSGSTYHGWADQLFVRLSVKDCQEDSVQLIRYWLQVAVSESVCPLVVDIRRTNGESLYSSPFIYQIYQSIYAPKVVLVYNNSYTVFSPTRVNDTLLVPAGNLSARFQWPYRDLLIHNFTTQTNQSMFLRFSAQFVRLDVECSQRIPELGISVAYYYGSGEYEHILAYSSPYFYTPSNRTLDIEVGSFDSSFRILGSTVRVRTFLTAVNTGFNRNMTLVIHPNWIQIGNLLIPPGKLISLLSFAMIVLIAPVYYKSKTVKSRAFIPWGFLNLSLIIPWLSSFDESPYVESTPIMNYITYRTGSPFFSTIVYNSDSNAVLMAQSERGIGIAILLWMIIFLVFVVTTGQLEGFESKMKEKAAGLGIVICCCIEFLYLAYLFQTYGYIGLMLEMGPFFSIVAVIFWLIHPLIIPKVYSSKPQVDSIETANA